MKTTNSHLTLKYWTAYLILAAFQYQLLFAETLDLVYRSIPDDGDFLFSPAAFPWIIVGVVFVIGLLGWAVIAIVTWVCSLIFDRLEKPVNPAEQ